MDNNVINEKPLVSVIMALYNCEETLSSAIDSIISQTYDNWELIMCDDCSKDNSYNIAKAYADKYKNIKLLKNNINQKLAYSLNRCLKISNGKYIARMDTDDISIDERLEKQVCFLENNPEIDVVGAAIIPFDENGDRDVRYRKEYPTVLDLKRDVTFFHPTIMMKKTVYDKLNGYKVLNRTIKGQDLDLWFRFFASGFKGANIQEPLLKYHESVLDYKKKRNIVFSWGMTKTCLVGFWNNNFPLYYYPWAFKHIVGALVPREIMYLYHRNR